jgi:hypothetical protein
MSELICLRALPGVQEVTDLCRNGRNFEYPTSSYTQQTIDKVSLDLFGVTQEDTVWAAEEGESAQEAAERVEYEEQFRVAQLLWPGPEPFWHAIGWDISDGKGSELISAHCFVRQIIAAEGELVEGSHLPGKAPAIWDDAAGLGRLQVEVDAFMARLGRRR